MQFSHANQNTRLGDVKNVSSEYSHLYFRSFSAILQSLRVLPITRQYEGIRYIHKCTVNGYKFSEMLRRVNCCFLVKLSGTALPEFKLESET